MMRRISPIVVLLVAAGCANAGIGDWFKPWWGGNKAHGNSGAQGPPGAAHSPKSAGHGRGSRQLRPSHGSGYDHPSTSHSHHGHAPPAPLLGSLPGSLDDGFKPSFPPGFANPPSYSPNLNPFATVAGHGSEAIAKGPFLPSQLTVYHTPKVDPAHAAAPLTKPVPLSKLKNGGNTYYAFPGHRARGARSGVPPHGAVALGSTVPDGTGPINPDGSPASYDQFPGLASEIEPQNPPEYEETPTTPPQQAPQQRAPRGPRGPFSFLSRYRQRSQGPSNHHNHHHHNQHNHHQGERPHFGRRPHHSGPPGGPPQGGPQGPDGPTFNIDGDGPSGNPFGGDDGPSGNPFGGENGPSGNPFGGDDGPQQNPFGNQEQVQNLFGGNGPSNGGPGPYGGGNSPLSAGPSVGGGNRDIFFATSPGSNSPFAPVIPEQGPGGPSPFGNPQSNPQFNQGPRPRPQGLFGQSSAPQGPPRGPPSGGPNGPQSFFGPNGNDYPEQFGGGNRGTRQPQHDDYRPQPNGPPDAPNDENQQHAGFYGAIHDSDSNPQLSNFFGNQGPPQGRPGNGPSPFGSPNGNPYGNTIQAHGESGPGFGNNHNSHSPNNGPRKPPRFGFRNPLAGLFQGSGSTLPSHNNNNNNGPLAMSASGAKPAITLPKVLRPFIKKPGSIIPLSSPKDPNYRPLSLGASSLSPITAAFEPDTAASGGYGGGYGNVGLTHNGDRILYHVAGHKGPYSYQFGYDTGKGHNRIFRFEEKDGKGFVKGKYGFYDKHGKLNIINYMAHPKHGYHAERGHSHGYY